MVKRYLKKIKRLLSPVNCIVFLFGLTFILLIFLIFFPSYMMFGAFKIKEDALTLGEIGGFIGGILSPLAFLVIFLTLKAQQDESRRQEQKNRQLLIKQIGDDQPKLLFQYDSYIYDQENFELSFNFSITNVGKDALKLMINPSISSDEDHLSNFLKHPSAIDHIPNYLSGQKTPLKFVFTCISEDSIKEDLSIELFCYYMDITQVDRAFYADLSITPRLDIGYQAKIVQRNHAI